MKQCNKILFDCLADYFRERGVPAYYGPPPEALVPA